MTSEEHAVETMVQRLRKQRDSFSALFALGRDAGRRWALEEATLAEMTNLSEARDKAGADGTDTAGAWLGDGRNLGGRILAILRPDSREDAASFWGAVKQGDRSNSSRLGGPCEARARGFAVGCLEAFDAVRDRI